MRYFLTVLSILLITTFGYCQNDINIVICNCFENLDYNKDIEKLKQETKDCIDRKFQTNKSEFEKLFKNSEHAVEFVKSFASSCESFLEFATYIIDSEKDLSDQERIQLIEEIANYFSFPSEKGKMPKTISIMPYEAGIVYNLYLNKLYPDSILSQGFHKLMPSDTVIIFNLKSQMIQENLQIELNDGLLSYINFELRFSLNKNHIGYLYESYGKNYKNLYLIPQLRSLIRNSLSKLTTIHLYEFHIDTLSQMIKENIAADNNIKRYLQIHNLSIKYIEYPNIISKAIEANLMKEYKGLQQNDKTVRIEAIDNLVENGSSAAILIILEHWQFEKDKKVQDYIIEKLSNKK